MARKGKEREGYKREGRWEKDGKEGREEQKGQHERMKEGKEGRI